MGAGCHMNQPCDWNFQPRVGRGAEGWITVTTDLINCACVMGPPLKTQKDKVWRAGLVKKNVSRSKTHARKIAYPKLHRDSCSCAWDPCRPHAVCLSVCCSVIPFNILCNKAEMVSRLFLSSVSCSGKLIKPEEGVVGASRYSQWMRSAGVNLDL